MKIDKFKSVITLTPDEGKCIATKEGEIITAETLYLAKSDVAENYIEVEIPEPQVEQEEVKQEEAE